ncbi:MAG TPA: DUF4236 domain-containing protein [Longimicrobium sp.]|jgi:hypothetical protein
MGFRFRKSIKILPGVRVNVGRSGISTTIGGRGASVNSGKRGTYLNAGVPGTGLSYRSRMDGASGSMGSSGSAGNGCLGCLGGLFVLMIMGTCMGSDPSSSPPTPQPLSIYEPSAPPAPTTDQLYIHEPLNVRSEPNKQGAALRTLPRGTAVRLGPKDENGWAPLYDYAGNADGYVYRASDAVRSYPAPERTRSAPKARSLSAGVTRRSSAESRGYYTGPRGGCYTYSASGRKRYVDRSYCR